MLQSKKTCFSLFLLSFAVLMIEMCLTRIFSVISWHHFAYLIISLALLGFGAAGSYLTVSRRFADEQINENRLSRFAWLFSVTLIGAIILVSRIRFYPTHIMLYRDYSNVLSLFILYIVIGIPFFFAGVCIGQMISLAGDRVNLFYFADLIGAGFGAFAALFVINYLGAVSGVFLAASLVAFAAFLLSSNSVRWQRFGYGLTSVLALGLVIITATLSNILPFYYPPSKSLYGREFDIEYSRWHVVGKIDIAKPKPHYWPFGGALSTRYEDTPPLVRGIYQDGTAPTGIVLTNEPPEKYLILGEYLQGIPYVVQPAKSSLVIGVGGGVDALIAMHYGVEDVLGVDLNPVIVNAMRKKYRSECPSLWNSGNFKVLISEGRHYLTHSNEKYDVIQLSGVDTFTALSSGAYVLSENFLYTRQAMYTYWQHLTDDGILSFSRWLFNPPRETLRLVTTQLEMLDDLGIEDKKNHFIVISGPAYRNLKPWAEVLLKRSPFTEEQVAQVVRWARERKFDIVFDPYKRRENEFDKFICADTSVRKKLISDYRFNVKPTTDNDPFFFQFYRWKSIFEVVRNKSGISSSEGGFFLLRLPLGLMILGITLVQMLVLSFAFIIVPLLMKKGLRSHRPGKLGVFLYFAALGIAFIFVEITLLQKFAVFVGGPVYSMGVTLFSILIFSGIGSYLAQGFRHHPVHWLAGVIVILLVLIFCEIIFLDHTMIKLMGLSLYSRWLVTVLAIAPLALLMGMPFPTGLRILQKFDESIRPWAWGINSCMTVIGSIACVILSMQAGFNASLLTAMVIYGIGMSGMLWAVWRNRDCFVRS